MTGSAATRSSITAGNLTAKELVVFDDEFRRLDLRIVADTGQFADVSLADEFAIARDHMRAGDRVGRTVDQRERAARIAQRTDPASSRKLTSISQRHKKCCRNSSGDICGSVQIR